jgi:hypothetical protein
MVLTQVNVTTCHSPDLYNYVYGQLHKRWNFMWVKACLENFDGFSTLSAFGRTVVLRSAFGRTVELRSAFGRTVGQVGIWQDCRTEVGPLQGLQRAAAQKKTDTHECLKPDSKPRSHSSVQVVKSQCFRLSVLCRLQECQQFLLQERACNLGWVCTPGVARRLTASISGRPRRVFGWSWEVDCSVVLAKCVISAL